MGVRAQALNSLRSAWTKKIQGMKKMNQSTMVRPFAPQQVIRVDEQVTGAIAKLDCGAAVFKLSERANAVPEMYVVVQGSICVRESHSSGSSLQTMWFRTSVGYFRWKRDRLEHVYGVHYDMDERGDGHPIFHAQLRPAMDFASAIQNEFRLDAELVDHVRPILRNVRTPTAQMDFFSVCTQLCADHLMSGNSTDDHSEVIDAFDGVRSACDFLQGAAHRMTYLNDGRAPGCYRSYHWYGSAKGAG